MKTILKSLKNERIILRLVASGFMFYTSLAYNATKKDLLAINFEYRDEFVKDRIEIYKSLSFMQKLSSFGEYLAAKEIYNQSNKNKN